MPIFTIIIHQKLYTIYTYYGEKMQQALGRFLHFFESMVFICKMRCNSNAYLRVSGYQQKPEYVEPSGPC